MTGDKFMGTDFTYEEIAGILITRSSIQQCAS